MKYNLNSWRSVAAMASLIVGLIGPTTSPLADEGSREELRSLSAEWWEWALAIPARANPLNDKAGDLCGVGQHGEVWFLGGTLDGSEVNRTCSIPAGKAIFLPVINFECSVVEPAPFHGESEAELRACAKGLADHVTKVKATVQKLPAGAERSLAVVRVGSPLFSFILPPDNILGMLNPTPNPSPSVSNGFWILLDPLPVGRYKLKFTGTAPFPDFTPAFTFESKGTYTLRVVPLSP